jgi:hypothetical protein
VVEGPLRNSRRPTTTFFCWSGISQRKDPALIGGGRVPLKAHGVEQKCHVPVSCNAWQCAGFPKSGSTLNPITINEFDLQRLGCS